MIDSGLPLVQCLEILGGQQENKTFQKILTGVRASVEGGATLSTSMKQYEKIFEPALFEHVVEAGETGGILDTILQRTFHLHRKERQAGSGPSNRPVDLSRFGYQLIAAGVITLLLWKVVPIFITLFNGLDVDLPLPSVSSSA